MLSQAAESALAGSTLQQARLEEALACLKSHAPAGDGSPTTPVPLYEQQPEAAVKVCPMEHPQVQYKVGVCKWDSMSASNDLACLPFGKSKSALACQQAPSGR